MSSVDLLAKFFELLSECQGLALKLWANPECKAMFPQGFTSMYQIVTAESHLSQGLSWELKVAAQERQKLFLQELEGRLIAPPPPPPAPPSPAASGRLNRRKRTASANSPISEPTPNQKKMRYRVAIPSTREEVYQHRYHWTPFRLTFEPCNYESKKMEICLQIQQIISIL